MDFDLLFYLYLITQYNILKFLIFENLAGKSELPEKFYFPVTINLEYPLSPSLP